MTKVVVEERAVKVVAHSGSVVSHMEPTQVITQPGTVVITGPPAPGHGLSFSVSAVVLDPSGPRTFPVWEAPWPCKAIAFKGRVVGSTGSSINAKNEGADLRAGALQLTTNDWTIGGTLQNTSFEAGDELAFVLANVVGVPTEIVMQVDFVRT